METRNIGGDGPALSVVGLGCNNFGMKLAEPESAAVVNAALDAGITHFDTAEMYGGGKSDEAVIATKFLPRPKDQAYTPGVLRDRIVAGVEGSLTRLGTDRIDLYYQHYPDAEGPVDEALETLADLVAQGKLLHLASSNVSAEQIAAAAALAVDKGWPRFVGTQIEWTPSCLPRWPAAWASCRTSRWRRECSPVSTSAASRSPKAHASMRCRSSPAWPPMRTSTRSRRSPRSPSSGATRSSSWPWRGWPVSAAWRR
jgi:hypothetical protein